MTPDGQTDASRRRADAKNPVKFKRSRGTFVDHKRITVPDRKRITAPRLSDSDSQRPPAAQTASRTPCSPARPLLLGTVRSSGPEGCYTPPFRSECPSR